jgi:hypothetical protein
LFTQVTTSSIQEKNISREDLVRAMSQINLKDEEIKELREENWKLK